ncbi:MAG: heparinase, partial [Planctomycetes bacterium]|nr:heparinase [Planctomycetota bacterium]
MNHRTLIAAVSTFGMGLVCTASAAAAEVSLEQVAAAIQRADQPPPTLLINARQEQIVQTHLQSDPFFNALADAIIQRADRYVGGKPVQRVMTGRRLLSVSRECLTRLSVLAAAFGLTEDFRYRDQAQAEMLAAAAFSDWNPSHFLDTAEMTAALGIGYDRFYNVLSDEARLQIRTAIIEKGLNPSFTPNQWWITAENNWNQV